MYIKNNTQTCALLRAGTYIKVINGLESFRYCIEYFLNINFLSIIFIEGQSIFNAEVLK